MTGGRRMDYNREEFEQLCPVPPHMEYDPVLEAYVVIDMQSVNDPDMRMRWQDHNARWQGWKTAQKSQADQKTGGGS